MNKEVVRVAEEWDYEALLEEAVEACDPEAVQRVVESYRGTMPDFINDCISLMCGAQQSGKWEQAEKCASILYRWLRTCGTVNLASLDMLLFDVGAPADFKRHCFRLAMDMLLCDREAA